MADLQVEGLAELERDLQRVERRLQGRVVRNAARAGAVLIRRKAKSLAPRATGQLVKDIVLRTKREPNGDIVARVGVKPLSFYGMFAEFGTSRQAARPWLRPAFDSQREQVAKAIQDRLWKEIRRFLK